MIEIGYLAACQTYYQKLVANVSIYDSRAATNTDYLRIDHFGGAFCILAIGLLGATIAFAFEIMSGSIIQQTINE